MFGSAIRWYVSMDALFHRQSDAGVHGTEGGFRTQVFTAFDPAYVDLADVRADLEREVERFTNVGPGWDFTAILRFVIRIGQYRPLVGSSFIPTPASLMPNHALIDILNPNDNMCFAWAVLSALHPVGEHAYMIWKYRPHLKSIDLLGLKFPVPVNQVARFEKNNPTISVSIYALGEDEEEILPKHVTKCCRRETHVDLLLLSSKNNSDFHYTWIKNMSALICRKAKSTDTSYVCSPCIHPFSSSSAVDNQFPDCSKHVYQVTRYPTLIRRKASLNGNRAKKMERVCPS
jgi:hypothetical protein